LKRLRLVFPERARISDKDDTDTVMYSAEQLRYLDGCESLLRDYSESTLRIML
jgi:hypothetical protein